MERLAGAAVPAGHAGSRFPHQTATGLPALAGPEPELSCPVGDLVSREAVFVPADAPVADVARTMREEKISSVLVEDGELGIVTSDDLRDRVLAEGLPSSVPVGRVMTRSVATLPFDAPLYAALLLMLDGGYQQVPIMRHGRVVGVITQTDLLRHQSRSPLTALGRIRNLDRPDAVDTLDGYLASVAATAGALLRDGVDPLRVARVVAALNDALTHRLLALAEERLGPPPCPYAWLALGSEGRMEQLPLSDQDNALVYAEPGPEHADYFARLAELVVGGLTSAGFPPCPGGFMATSWCRPLDEWVDVATNWLAVPEAKALVEAEVFLDFRPIHGTLSLDPMYTTMRRGARSPVFLVQLARAATTFSPPLGAFGRIKARDHQVDLKLGGTVPIVLLARLYSLAAGSSARSTLDRLADAAADGQLSAARVDLLSDAFTFLMGLRLRSQLAELAAGAEPDNRVRLDELSWLEQRRLRDTFRTITETQRATSAQFHHD